MTADWCHAWSTLGQWSGHVTFPVPASRVWPRHGHLRKILDAYKGRQPNFHKWARPAFEQGALPTLSMLPGEVAVRVLPGDKMYQAMTIEPKFMRPAILHGFFFPSCASVALARSSHLVVLMNELRKCIHCIPLWGFKSGAKSLQSGASSKTKNQQRHNKKQTPTTHTPNNTKQKQNAKGNMA